MFVSAFQDSGSPRGPPQARDDPAGQLIDARSGQVLSDPAAFAHEQGVQRLPIFVNGINTSQEESLVQARLADALVVFYNPSAGAIADLNESGIEKFLGPTELDKQFRRVLDTLAEAGVRVEITAYSQGTLITTRAITSDAQLAEGSTVRFVASAVSEGRSRAVVKGAGGHLDFRPTHFLDPINTVQDLYPSKMFGGAVGLVRDLATGFRYSAHRFENYVDQ